MSTDPFSDVLRLTEAKSVMAGGFGASGAWGHRIPAPGVIVFAAIARGSCWLRGWQPTRPGLLEDVRTNY